MNFTSIPRSSVGGLPASLAGSFNYIHTYIEHMYYEIPRRRLTSLYWNRLIVQLVSPQDLSILLSEAPIPIPFKSLFFLSYWLRCSYVFR